MYIISYDIYIYTTYYIYITIMYIRQNAKHDKVKLVDEIKNRTLGGSHT